MEEQEDLVVEPHESFMRVKAGSLPALVENLTRDDRLDAAFNRTFLTTYMSFTTASQLHDLLVRRFNVPPPAGLNPTQVTEWADRTKSVIQLRVINVMKQWLEHFWIEPASPETTAVLQKMQTFVRDAIPVVEKGVAQQLLAIVERRLLGQTPRKNTQPSIRNAPKPITPRNLNKIEFLKVDPIEIARQLTILESYVFSKVQANELLNKAWQKKKGADGVELAPNVRALIRYSNQISNWVGGLVLEHADLKRRTQVINHIIQVAHICSTLRNYSAVISIMSGLDSAPIYRLDRTWSQVSERSCNLLEPLRQLMSSASNFGVYRDALRVAVPPCIPFLGAFALHTRLIPHFARKVYTHAPDIGLYLKDLTFIDDGNPCTTAEGFVNFQKYTLLASTIHEIQRFKEASYALHPVPALQEYLSSQIQSASDLYDMWDRSRSLEPRGRGDENAHRLSYTSTGSHMSAMVIASLAIDE